MFDLQHLCELYDPDAQAGELSLLEDRSTVDVRIFSILFYGAENWCLSWSTLEVLTQSWVKSAPETSTEWTRYMYFDTPP